MPLYYFHLTFGERTVADEEGVELRDRAAAHEEARAVVRDLSDRGAGKRWASWFLNVTDEQGSFLRLPIGYPALEVLPEDGHRPIPAAPSLKPSAALLPREPAPEKLPENRAAALVRERTALRQRTAELLARNWQVQEELFSQISLSEQIRTRTGQLLASARLLGWLHDGNPGGDGGHPRRARPQLVPMARGGEA
jgi:hypothetical protein